MREGLRFAAAAAAIWSVGGVNGTLGDEYDRPADMPGVVVVGTPLPTPTSSFGLTTRVLGSNILRRTGGGSVGDLLEELTFTDVRERGGSRVQADLSIRGSTFEQVLVTIDGVPFVDAQTGHHNMDLPFPAAAAGQVVVIPGPVSALFGPRAFGGVVDIIPRRPVQSGGHARLSYGSFDTRHDDWVVDHVGEGMAGTAAGVYERSSGFMRGTDYELSSVWGSGFIGSAEGGVRVSAGHVDKDFGARDFYAPFPSRERTSATLVDVAPELVVGEWRAKAVIRYRHHDDEFILIEDDPSFYRNVHETDTFTERLVINTPLHVLGQTAIGVERSDAGVESSVLGDRDTYVSSGFAQHRVQVGTATLDAGVRVDHDRRWGDEVSPSLSVAIPLCSAATVRARGGRGIRPPSFTDLYYEDPSNIGKPDLKPEEAVGGEVGLDLSPAPDVRGSVAWFIRDTDDLIDWVRATPDDPWRATNIGGATFQGVEALADTVLAGLGWSVGYRYTDVDADSTGLQSKSALNVARHDARFGVELAAPGGFSAGVAARYRDVPTLDDYWLLSARVAKACGPTTLFLAGRNLADEEYAEVPGVPTAGVSVEVGVETVW